MNSATISLSKSSFPVREIKFVEYGGLAAHLFTYDSGVQAVKLANDQGYIVLLPYMGQQVWNAFFGGRFLNMKAMYPEPRSVDNFLESYGCFVMHCGPLRMGCPGPEDHHPLHGTLPAARFDRADLVLGEDEQGKYLGLSGVLDRNTAFAEKYRACPLVKLHEGSSLVDIQMTIENYSHYPMELMYMCHVNFRPVEYGRIVQSVDWTQEGMKLRKTIPEHVSVSEGFRDFMARLDENPRLTEVIKPEDEYNPEVVFFVQSPHVDEQGWSHFMQVHPDGSADYIRYKPEELDHSARWISRTEDQAGLGLALPATCDPEGYTAEKRKGNIKMVPGQTSVSFSAVAGYLGTKAAQEMEKKINRIMA
jgi:Domain of unknown function (DUF4432)